MSVTDASVARALRAMIREEMSRADTEENEAFSIIKALEAIPRMEAVLTGVNDRLTHMEGFLAQRLGYEPYGPQQSQ